MIRRKRDILRDVGVAEGGLKKDGISLENQNGKRRDALRAYFFLKIAGKCGGALGKSDAGVQQ